MVQGLRGVTTSDTCSRAAGILKESAHWTRLNVAMNLYDRSDGAVMRPVPRNAQAVPRVRVVNALPALGSNATGQRLSSTHNQQAAAVCSIVKAADADLANVIARSF